MKNGFWNYTEPITYRVILVNIRQVIHPPMHWQNAFVGKQRQAVQVYYFDHMGECKTFLLDNEDGSGILKIEKGGGPDSMSRHIPLECADVINEFTDTGLWKMYNEEKRRQIDREVDQWSATNYPEDHARIQALKDTIIQMKRNQFAGARNCTKPKCNCAAIADKEAGQHVNAFPCLCKTGHPDFMPFPKGGSI
jgi:hypothetical protein